MRRLQLVKELALATEKAAEHPTPENLRKWGIAGTNRFNHDLRLCEYYGVHTLQFMSPEGLNIDLDYSMAYLVENEKHREILYKRTKHQINIKFLQ